MGAETAVAAAGEAAALLSIPVRASTATITILIASSRPGTRTSRHPLRVSHLKKHKVRKDVESHEVVPFLNPPSIHDTSKANIYKNEGVLDIIATK